MLGLLPSPSSSASSKFAISTTTKRLVLFLWLALVAFLGLVHSFAPSTPSSQGLSSADWSAALASFAHRAAAQSPLAFSAASEPAPAPKSAALPDIWHGKRIAVREDALFHEEVFGALLYSLRKSGVEPRLFRKEGFRFGFLDAVRSFWPEPAWERIDDGAFDQAMLENEVDILLLSTCSLHIDPLLPVLLDARSKVHVACLTHWGSDPHNNNERYAPLAAAGRLSLITLSDHVGKFVETQLGNMAVENEGGHGEAWDRIDVSTFVPTFPVPAVHHVHASKPRPSHFPSKLGIQGNISSSRRNYAGVIAALYAALLRDPTAWGYKWSRSRPEDRVFVPIHERGAPEPFELHLMGNLEEVLEIPREMEGVVRIHQGQSYDDYYSVLAEMDSLLPAFSHSGYTWDMASSSIGAALIAEIPVLCPPAISSKYAYLSGPALLPHPNSMDPIEAVRLYRAGANAAEGLARGNNVDARGQGWDAYLEDVDRRNVGVWEQLLARLD